MIALAAILGLATVRVPEASAGCGCTKPPPPPASVRPNFTYGGALVTLIDASLVDGQSYQVLFRSGVGSEEASVDGIAGLRRDLADAVVKAQLSVPLPRLPLGPASIEVRDAAGSTVLTIADDQFTVVPRPVVLTEALGMRTRHRFRAAVGRDGTVYLALDLTAVRAARTFDVWGNRLPLRFGTEDVVIYNTQGFLMQLLNTPIPGLVSFSTTAKRGYSSDRLRYYRHEFETYFLAHGERGVHLIDPADENWHLDGTPHIDHNHLIVAIAGTLDGATPQAGSVRLDLKVHPFSERRSKKEGGQGDGGGDRPTHPDQPTSHGR
jgi:hypothetical protein